MFRDQKKELARLEQALLEQEETEEELAEETPAVTLPENAAYNNDLSDVDLDEFGEDVYDPPKKRSLGPMAFAFVLLTALFCFLIWFMLKNGGYLG